MRPGRPRGRREDGAREGVARSRSDAPGRARRTASARTRFAVLGVLPQHGEDGLDRHGGLLLVPAVVVGDERHRGVADLGLAAELRLRRVRHADHVDAPGAVEERLGPRRELRPLDAHVRPAPVARRRFSAFAAASRASRRTAETGWANDTWPTQPSPKNVETRRFVRSRNWSGRTMSVGSVGLLHRAAGRGREQARAAQLPEAPDVRAVVDLGGQEAVVASVPGEEGDGDAGEVSEEVGVGRGAEGRLERDAPRAIVRARAARRAPSLR